LAKIYHDDTIGAIATPIGEGAIAVIRVSGPDAIALADGAFVGKSRLSDAKGYTVHFGRIYDAAHQEIDEVLCTVFRNPNSYTGEDAVEISCHGGIYVTHRVLEALLSFGIRRAEAGEFTRRAFLNGKMDLSQAEAVASVISAKTEAAHRASLDQLEGRFSNEIRKLRTDLLDLRALVELELDFSEEGIDLIPQADILRRLDNVQKMLQAMVNSYELGRVLRDGVSVAIVGKPNAGKSSLFNSLLGNKRAIVTEIPGTTRDTLEESVVISGLLFRLTDSAGLRKTTDIIEKEGVERTIAAAKGADLLLHVLDASSDSHDDTLLNSLGVNRELGRSIIIQNKVDLLRDGPSFPVLKAGGEPIVFVSAKTGYGIEDLREAMVSSIGWSGAESDSIRVTNARHKDCLVTAMGSIASAGEAASSGVSGEFIANDIGSASDALGEIIGEVTADDVLDNIFQSFCIGK
jgi:tRNA modification GTPase